MSVVHQHFRKSPDPASRFSSAARNYSSSADIQWITARKLVARLPGKSSPADILDLGCGTGILTRMMAHRYPTARITAIDSAPKMITHAKREAPDGSVHWITADARSFRLPFAFDLIVSNAALHWILPLNTVFERCKEHLSHGGKICLALMLDGTLDELRGLRERIAPHKAPKTRLPSPPDVLVAAHSAGLALHEFEVETVSVVYPDCRTFLQCLHRQGVTGGSAASRSGGLNRGELVQLASEYDRKYAVPSGGVIATYRVMFAEFINPPAT